jgi:TDG/mug DNA glycosylase family protein
MDRPTVEVYEHHAEEYVARGSSGWVEGARALATAPGWKADLGCGHGPHVDLLGEPVVAVDAAESLLRRAGGCRVLADLGALPFRRGALAAGWASKSYQHVAHEDLPAALADLHRALAVDAPVGLTLFAGGGTALSHDDLPGRRFSLWEPEALTDVLVGAGFAVESLEVEATGDWPGVRVRARRLRTLPDHVGPGMRLLLCGLNPSLYAADRGVSFARPGNRFWPALLGAGLVTVDRDPAHALRVHGVGMTDLVKRATVAAAELTAEEYAEGVQRVERLCAWLRPAVVGMVGLAGWRAAVDRRATTGWQERALGGCPVYVMPSTSGLNASTQHEGFVGHLRMAVTPPRHASGHEVHHTDHHTDLRDG